MAIRALLRQIQARGELAIVVDPECEYVSEFYRPVRGDLILNPIDERCPYWSPWLELSERYYQADAATLAASLIPEPPRGYESGSDHFFRQSSRTLLESLLQVAASREPQSIPKLLELNRDQLKQALSGTPAYSLIDPGAHEQGAGIIATVANATRPFLYLPPSDGRPPWSAREWAEHSEGWLFVTMRDESNSAALPLANLWLDLIVGRLLNSASDRRRVWIVVDELPVLGRQAKLETLVTRGRKRGLAAILGFQSIAQLRRIYGHEQAAVLASMPSTKLLLRVDEPETAAFIARQIGDRETLREEIGMSTAEHGNRFNIHPTRRTEPVVMASEIQRLPKLEGYLCIAGLDRARVKVKPCLPHRRQVQFIPRALPRPVSNGPGADLAALTVARGPIPPNGTAGAAVRIQD
jgi:type IV secretory pathway TraG/TraD family ATPase VirD4